MLNKKLFEILAHWQPTEIRRFRLFLKSPYFNHGLQANSLIRLFDMMESHGFDDTAAALAKPNVFQAFFPDHEYRPHSKGPLDALSSELFRLMKVFLELEREKTLADIQENITLAAFYRKHGYETRFVATVALVRKRLDAVLIKDAGYFLLKYALEEEVASFQTANNSFDGDANLFEANRFLDIGYLIGKLELLCSLYFQHKMSGGIDVTLLEAMEQMVDLLQSANQETEVPLVFLYNKVLALLQRNDAEKDFIQFSEALQQHENNIPRDKFYNFQAYYRFFWIRYYYQSGDPQSAAKLFDIYRKHYERGFFTRDGMIQANSLRNLLNFALKNRAFTWIKRVLDAHPPETILGTRYGSEVMQLNYAEYYFYLEDFDKALEYLAYRNFENPVYGFLADILQIKIYFHLDEELMLYRMKSLDMKIRRSKLSSEIKSRYFNFLHILHKINKFKIARTKSVRDKLDADIKAIPNLLEREWLLQRLA